MRAYEIKRVPANLYVSPCTKKLKRLQYNNTTTIPGHREDDSLSKKNKMCYYYDIWYPFFRPFSGSVSGSLMQQPFKLGHDMI